MSTTATSTTTAVATVVKITATATAQEENDEHQQNDAPNGADDEQHGPVEEGRLAEGLVQTLRGHVGETGRCAEHLVEVAASARVEADGVIVRALEAGRRGQAVAQLEGSLAGALRQRGHLGEARLGVIGDQVLTGFRYWHALFLHKKRRGGGKVKHSCTSALVVVFYKLYTSGDPPKAFLNTESGASAETPSKKPKIEEDIIK